MGTLIKEDIKNVGVESKQREQYWKHLIKQRKEGILCDITFKCSDGDVSAHKCVLASVSEYFKVLFTSSISSASSTNVVVFDDFSVDVVSLLLDIIYASVDIPAVHVVELLRLADFVQWQWLVEKLVEIVRKHINESNVCGWYGVAKGFGLTKLKFLCECYVRENIEKLQLEDVQRSFESNVLDEINLWDPDLDREVVIINSLYGVRFTDTYFIDPKLNKIEMFNGEWFGMAPNSGYDCEAVKEFWSEKATIDTVFVHQNVVYLVTKSERKEPSVYSIWKFQHVTKSLELVYVLEEQKLMDTLADDGINAKYFLRKQLFYDGQGNLFFLCRFEVRDPRTSPCDYEQVVFKFDMVRLLFFEGYLLGKLDTYEMAYLTDHHTCLITSDYVFCLKDHGFEVRGFDVDSLLKIELKHRVTNKVLNDAEVQNIPTHHLEWETWYPVNKGGQFYCLVDDMNHADQFYNLILRLDMKTRSWVLCAGLAYNHVRDGDDGPNQMLFHCGSIVYRHWMHGYYGDSENRPETSYLDETESVLKAIELSPAIHHDYDIRNYTVAPYHILL